MPNLAQVEFFHVGRKSNPSLDEYAGATQNLIEEMLSSLKTGASISSHLKTVVRFFDSSNVLSQIALESKKLQDADTELSGQYAFASLPGRVLISSEIQQIAGAKIALARVCMRTAITELRNSVKTSREIAVEKPDHTFRLAQKDELLELVESAKGSHAVWLFVFEPNDILSDTNKSVASAM